MEGDGGLKYWSQEGKQGRQLSLTELSLLKSKDSIHACTRVLNITILKNIDPVFYNLIIVGILGTCIYQQNMILCVLTVGIVNTLHAYTVMIYLHACLVNTVMIQCSNRKSEE